MSENGHKPLEVELPVCPKCRHVGRLPNYSAGGAGLKNFCTGSAADTHSRTKMEWRPFVEKVG